MQGGLTARAASRPVCVLTGGFARWHRTAWRIALPAQLAPLTDDSDAPSRSPLLLVEDGEPLGAGHDLHADILDKGGGRYSFWRGHLFFSTPDGSDPNRNGRAYAIRRVDCVPVEPPPAAGRAEDPLPLLFDASERGFIAEYRALLRLTPDPVSPFPPIGRKFVVGFTARVGSTLLCEALFDYGVVVAEFFNPVHIANGTYIPAAADYQDLCDRLVGTYAVNDAWGLKAHIQSLIPLFLIGEFAANLASWRFVYLTRDNIVRQAISSIIARTRQSWVSWQPPGREIGDADYSRDEIARTIAAIRRSQALWERFFERFGVRPLRLSYEAIAADPHRQAARVAAHCGLSPGGGERVARFRHPRLQPQATRLNAVLGGALP